jgi:hypothetical protein
LILNVLKNIEHENHPQSSAQVEVVLDTNIKTQNHFDYPYTYQFNNSRVSKFPTTKFWRPQKTGARGSCSQ